MPNAAVQRYVESEGFSRVVLVALGGKPIFRRGFGYRDREQRIPDEPDTKFRIGASPHRPGAGGGCAPPATWQRSIAAPSYFASLTTAASVYESTRGVSVNPLRRPQVFVSK